MLAVHFNHMGKLKARFIPSPLHETLNFNDTGYGAW